DRASQVDHALDVLGRIDEARYGLVAANLLHSQDVYAVLFLAEPEEQELPACLGAPCVFALSGGIHDRSTPRSCCRSLRGSRVSPVEHPRSPCTAALTASAAACRR